MREITIHIENATPENIAPYGSFVGAADSTRTFAAWPGTTIFGEYPIKVETGGEILLVQAAGKSFPHTIAIIERHFQHTQTYLPFNGKPFVMILGTESEGDAPILEKLRAFRFDGRAGIILAENVWHDFPYAIEDDTQFSVVLSNLSHINELKEPLHAMEAYGPDLERRSVQARAIVKVAF
jgi:ureidoglycolate lyase